MGTCRWTFHRSMAKGTIVGKKRILRNEWGNQPTRLATSVRQVTHGPKELGPARSDMGRSWVSGVSCFFFCVGRVPLGKSSDPPPPATPFSEQQLLLLPHILESYPTLPFINITPRQSNSRCFVKFLGL